MNNTPHPKLDLNKLQEAYRKASNRQFFLDYDGTLAAIVEKPEDAKPSEELLKLLKSLSSDKNNSIYIISGRDRKCLEEWVGNLHIGLSAEHGAFLRPNHSQEWRDIIKRKHMDLKWKDDVLSCFKKFCEHVPRAKIEAKEYAITLHYRLSKKEDVKPNKLELKAELDKLSSKYDTLDVRKGKKSLEARVAGITKGFIIREILSSVEKNNVDFVLCIGDDVTDEDMFVELAQEKQLKSVFTVTVGKKTKTSSTSYVEKQSDVFTTLGTLCDITAP
jgi:trehalose 6-phosphate synthase/phosphatase